MCCISKNIILDNLKQIPVLSSSLAYFGVLHILHSDLLAQLTLPHLWEEKHMIDSLNTGTTLVQKLRN